MPSLSPAHSPTWCWVRSRTLKPVSTVTVMANSSRCSAPSRARKGTSILSSLLQHCSQLTIRAKHSEQNGFYRELINLIPSSAPFLTRSAAPFAFSALNQNFVVNGTCPGPANALLFKSLPIFGVLNVDTKNIALADQTLTFSVKTSSSYADVAGWSVTFINQQNVPVTKPITNIKLAGGVATFDAFFPAETLLMNALTISAVTHGASSFASVSDVATATLFGPGLIEIN